MQTSKLVVGQEVKIGTRGRVAQGCTGKVVKITDDEVEVLVPPPKEEDILRFYVGRTPEEQKRIIATYKPELYRFDKKTAQETDESVENRGFGIDPDYGPWYLEQDETVN